VYPPECTVLKKLCIVGAQIIDLMMLVIDITKGIQTQTAEVIYTLYVHVPVCVLWRNVCFYCMRKVFVKLYSLLKFVF